MTNFYLGNNAGSSGFYSMSDTSSLAVSVEQIGYYGTGSFNQSGGTHTVDTLYIGNNAGSSGAYSMSNSASLAVAGGELIGNYGTGTFYQTGGTHTAGSLILGEQIGSTGTYYMSNQVSLVSSDEHIGFYGSGVQSDRWQPYRQEYLQHWREC